MNEQADESTAARATSGVMPTAVANANTAPISIRKVTTPRQRMIRIFVAVIVVLILPYRLRVTGQSVVVSTEATEATAPGDGIVEAVKVKEGDPVQAGDPIAMVVGKDGTAVGKVASPIAGVVATPTHALQARVGSFVKAGDPLATVFDRTKLVVRVDVSQRDLADTKVGQVAQVKLQGYPGETLAGKVTRISDVARTSRGDVVMGVDVTLDETPAWARPGMRGWTKLGGDVTLVGVLIGRRLARSLWIELWSLF